MQSMSVLMTMTVVEEGEKKCSMDLDFIVKYHAIQCHWQGLLNIDRCAPASLRDFGQNLVDLLENSISFK